MILLMPCCICKGMMTTCSKTDPKVQYGMPVLMLKMQISPVCEKKFITAMPIDNDLFYKENTLMLFADAR